MSYGLAENDNHGCGCAVESHRRLQSAPRVVGRTKRVVHVDSMIVLALLSNKSQLLAMKVIGFYFFSQITHFCSVDASWSSRSLGGHLGRLAPHCSACQTAYWLGPSAFKATLAWLKHSLTWKEPVERFRLLPSNNCRKPTRALSDSARTSSPLLLLPIPSSLLSTTNRYRQQHPPIEASYSSQKATSIITIQNGSWKPARQGPGEEPQEAGQ